MDKLKKTVFPDFVGEKLNLYVGLITYAGEFFDNPKEFSDQESKDVGNIYLWNILGQELLQRYLNDPENIYFTEGEMEKILTSVIIQTNLHLLMKDNLVDGIENENGEMVYWLTDKGKEIHKSLGDD